MHRTALGSLTVTAGLLIAACGGSADDVRATDDVHSLQSGASSGRQERVVIVQPHFNETLPAGVVCDFDLMIDNDMAQKIVRFFNADGLRERAVQQITETNRFTNLETGAFVEEQIQYARHLDFAPDAAYPGGFRVERESITGVTYQTRDADGNLVASSAGRLDVMLCAATPPDVEVCGFQATPHVILDFAGTICTALGGAPAVQ